MFDVCVIGHVTRDRVSMAGGERREQPGGTAYYAAMAYAGLGLDVAVVTKVAAADEGPLLGDLEGRGVTVVCELAEATTTFENTYSGAGLDQRTQKVTAMAPPFAADDLGDLEAGLYHLGPLTAADMAAGFIAAVAARDGRLALDVQGLMREVVGDVARPRDWPDKTAGLAPVDVVKADAGEARLLSGAAEPARAARRIARLGPAEVVITLGAGGSLVLAEGRHFSIPAFPPRRLVDPTGCGDSYLAGYLYHSLGSDDAEAAGRFAAALAACKLERAGPFMGDAADVRARLRA
jgi:sugar/nucleoside kinase (ribokinase family)